MTAPKQATENFLARKDTLLANPDELHHANIIHCQ